MTAKVESNVVAPTTSKEPVIRPFPPTNKLVFTFAEPVVAMSPDTFTLFLNVAAPVTAKVESNVVAPTASNEPVTLPFPPTYKFVFTYCEPVVALSP